MPLRARLGDRPQRLGRLVLAAYRTSEEIDWPLLLAIGVKSKRITKEQARELLQRYGRDIWNRPDQSMMDDELRAWMRLCLGRPARPAEPGDASKAE
ncbi:MAG: hypothetical protein V9H69_24130 [Anaerolineae bacterium]